MVNLIHLTVARELKDTIVVAGIQVYLRPHLVRGLIYRILPNKSPGNYFLNLVDGGGN